MTSIGDEGIFVVKCDNCEKSDPIEASPHEMGKYHEANYVVQDRLNEIKYNSMHFCEKCYPLIQEMIIERSARD